MLDFKSWRSDAQASLVVSLVALPLCLGIALASGAPLSSGIVAGIIGGIVVGLFSGSSISVSGPAAGLTVIVLNSLTILGSFEAFLVALVLSGILQIIMGLIKAGTIGNYFPQSVIKGMLAAIGLILILKQLPHAFGYDADFMGDTAFSEQGGLNTFTRLLATFEWLHPGALFVAVTSFVVILMWDKKAKNKTGFFKILPSALVAIIVSIIINEVFKKFFPAFIITETHLVQLPMGGGLTSGRLAPNWAFISEPKLWITAVTLAMVGSLESLLSVEAADKIDETGSVTSKNRELLAQGVGNTISGFLGGLPITAVIVRTSVNASAGAATNLSAFLHGIWLLVFVLLIPNLLNLIPLATLAAVLILVGYKLTKPELYKSIKKKGMDQFIPFIITILAILFTDLLMGILLGIVVGFIFVIKSSVTKAIVVVQEGNDYLIRFHKDVSFLQKSRLLSIFDSIPEGTNVFIDGSRGVYVDADIEEAVEDYMKRCANKKINVTLKKSSLSLSSLFQEITNG
jgi:MFS superfamily sulfate permease-like transporter